MSIQLVRIDDRLIHGQVVVGWVQALKIQRIVLVDDETSGDPFERELSALGVPPGIELAFASVSDAATQVEQWGADDVRTLLLAPDVDTIVRLAEQTHGIERVNLGGVHGQGARSKRLTYVYLSDQEVGQLEQLSARGVEVTAQDVPSARPVALEELK